MPDSINMLPRILSRCAACLALAGSLLDGAPDPAGHPNIILILLDDAGYADFGFMGSDDIDTPRIDELARDGTIFSDFHVTATVCAPSRAGLVTGRYQQSFEFECNIPPEGRGIDPRETTIAEALRDEGYRTMLVGKWHLGNDPAFHPNVHGFDEFYGFLEGGRSYFFSKEIDHPHNPRAILHNRRQVPFEGYLTDVFTDKAIDFVRESPESPFFLFLSYNAPHTPMEAKAEHLEKYAEHPRATFAAMMWSVDENIGRLRAELEELGVAENTLIFFFSDNGGAENNQSSNRPLKGWKGNKFEGGHRVPCIVSWPGRLPKGAHHHGLSSALDVFPTALAAAGGEPLEAPHLDGINLLPLLEGRVQPDPGRKLFWRKDRMAAMREGPHKLIRLEAFGYRLYDLDANLSEDRDLREARPDRFNEMATTLIQWESGLKPPLWYESEDWTRVTWEIHADLMNNRQVRFKTPWELEQAATKAETQ